jgi:hypothetical protein
VIAEGNYGQTEGVFLCLLSFARAKKVRRLPAVTGTTAIGGKALSLQYSRGLQKEEEVQANRFFLSAKRPETNPRGRAPCRRLTLFARTK